MAVKENYNIGYDCTTINCAHAYGVYQTAQLFTAEDSTARSSVKLLLFRTGSPGTLTCTLQSVTAARPDGNVLATGTTDGDTLTTSVDGDWREITFETPYTVTDEVQYAIVLSAVGDSSNKGRWQADISNPTYTGGTKCWTNNSGSSWTIDGNKDMMFEMYGGVEDVEMAAAIAGTSALSATQTRTQSSSATPDTQIQYKTRLVACNNDQFWYESG